MTAFAILRGYVSVSISSLISASQAVIETLQKQKMHGTQLTMKIDDSEVSVEDVVSNTPGGSKSPVASMDTAKDSTVPCIIC